MLLKGKNIEPPIYEVTLTHWEMFLGGMHGLSRLAWDMDGNHKDKHGTPPEQTWKVDCVGSIGELVIAKYYKRYYSGNLGNFKAGDVGNLQVRTTFNKNGRLWCHRADKDDHVFILVRAHRAPVFEVCGWKFGRDVKLEEYFTDPQGSNRHAFYLPNNLLEDMHDLVVENVFS